MVLRYHRSAVGVAVELEVPADWLVFEAPTAAVRDAMDVWLTSGLALSGGGQRLPDVMLAEAGLCPAH